MKKYVEAEDCMQSNFNIYKICNACISHVYAAGKVKTWNEIIVRLLTRNDDNKFNAIIRQYRVDTILLEIVNCHLNDKLQVD